jgi:hypothetical protein
VAPKVATWKESLIRDTYATSEVGPPLELSGEAKSSIPAFAARFAHAGREQFRDGIVWAEVMGKPLALRDE